MTHIYNGDGVTLDSIGVVPFVGIRHVVSLPSANGRAAARQCTLYGINCEERITYVSLHIFIRVGMAIFLSYVFVERSDLGSGTLSVEVLILHLYSRI